MTIGQGQVSQWVLSYSGVKLLPMRMASLYFAWWRHWMETMSSYSCLQSSVPVRMVVLFAVP
uniref:Uncharacterized protein n=1 Tax=Arundo donax TaxID=35708 RepID=A0A0A9ANH4_ARUDO